MFSGKSVLGAGEPTGKKETIGKLLSPLTKEEVGSIRCIGLNVSGALPEPSYQMQKQTLRFVVSM